MHDLDPSNSGQSWATAVNNVGQVVGYRSGSGSIVAFLYSGGTLEVLPWGELDGGHMEAWAINDYGRVVGWGRRVIAHGEIDDATPKHAFLYFGGTTTDLGTFGGPDSDARGVNNAGQIVGSYGWKAFLYSGGSITTLEGLGSPLDINDVGQVVGGGSIYSGGVVTSLGTLGGSQCMAWGLNNAGQVVGWDALAGGSAKRAFLYAQGTMVDLNTRVAPEASCLCLECASDINERGEICGWATVVGNLTHAYKLVPNAQPVAQGDAYQVSKSVTLTVAAGGGVLINDTDSDADTFGQTLTAVEVNAPSHGTLASFGADGAFTYTPTPGYTGPDSFSYKVNDGLEDSAGAGTVTLSVTNTPPGPPTSVSAGTQGGDLSTYTLTACASGATDADGDTVTYEYQWSSLVGGAEWTDWLWEGVALAHADLVSANQWKARARASDGTDVSSWVESAPLSTQASQLCVDAAMASSGDGTSWPTALRSITEAINVAIPGATVTVKRGTYRERLNFGGKTLVVQSTDPSSPNVSAATIINGGQAGPVVSFVSGESAATVLSGFTITGGEAEYGGGIVCSGGAAPQITLNRIQGNSATSGGGGISVLNAAPTIADNTISGNQATGDGGGIRIAGSRTAVLARNIIRNNTAASGGGVLCDGAAPQLSENTIRNNTATQGGGIGCQEGAEPAIDANSLTENQADYGGGVYCEGSTPTLTGNTVSANSADGGGGLYLYNCSPAVTGNTITDNTADDGAGIFGQGCGSTIRDAILAGNIATRYGGGLYLLKCTGAQLESSTLDANRATSKGGGVCLQSSLAELHNTIISNSPAGGGVYLVSGDVPTITYCNVYNNLPADYLGMTAPAAAALASASGNLRTDPGYADRSIRDYHLKSQSGRWDPGTGAWVIDPSHSACIDNGDPASSYGKEPQPNGSRLNIGAYGNTAEASKGLGAMAAHTPASDGPSCSRRTVVLVTFRWPVAQASAEEHLQLSDGTGSVAGAWDWLVPFVRARFTPAQALGKSTRYTLGLAAGTRRRDGALVKWDESFSFTTGAEPVVTSCGPKGSAVGLRARVSVVFDTPMHKASVQKAFRIVPALEGTFAWSGQQLIFTHATPFAAGTSYRVAIGAKARSTAGKPLGKAFASSFATAPSHGPAALTAVATPTAAGAQIAVTLAAAAEVTISVRNLAGREVALLQLGLLPAGTRLLAWNGQSRTGTRVPGGTYLVQVQARAPQGAAVAQVLPLRLP